MQGKEMMRHWLSERGITSAVQDTFGVSWDTHPQLGECIFLPVYHPDGSFAFNKYRRNPLEDALPKYIYDKGGRTTLYGYHLIKPSDPILIVEGELDCLVAWSHNIPAVSSTGGALSFNAEWAELLAGHDLTLCFDNDEAGAQGMVRALAIIPQAKVVLIPETPGVKDISDYVAHGGDLQNLLTTAKHYPDLASVKDDGVQRSSMWQSTRFHHAYVSAHQRTNRTVSAPLYTKSDSRIERAKIYPISELIHFVQGKAKCPFHNESLPSLHYYKKENRVYCFGMCGKMYDSIDVYRQLHRCSFKEAIDRLQ